MTKIISGPELLPLQVEEGLSMQRKLQSLNKELEEFNGKVFIDSIDSSNDNITTWKFDNYYVHVDLSVAIRFEKKFEPFLVRETKTLTYDNLINICIMVKDAGDGFRDILKKNLPYMDRYTILDTGSTDNTVSIIKEVLAEKWGTLYQEPFINFRDSRNRLLDLAGESCYYNIMLDDTYVLNGKVREFLDMARGDNVVHSYSLVIESTDTLYTSNRITESSKKLRYINLVHEIIDNKDYMNCLVPRDFGYITDVNSDYMSDRTKARKGKDIDTLIKMLEEDPANPRTYYYIADSYLCTKEWNKALEWFIKRSKMNGYDSEVQDSLYYIAVLKDMYLQYPWNECLDAYLKCYEVDNTRAESLYFIGQHYNKIGMTSTAFIYWKKAFELGTPTINMSVRKNIYNIHIPKDLASICYYMKDYKLGEEAARRALANDPDDKITDNWLHIFYHINKSNITSQKVRVSKSYTICFISSGGWSEWDGETLVTKGLGGSETFTIKYSEELVKKGYNVIVFCKCSNEKVYNGVSYKKDTDFVQFISNYIVDTCIINRFPEYIPIACLNNIKTYYVMHDLPAEKEIIILDKNLAGTLCISEWHKEYFLSYFPSCKSRTHVISYGINVDDFNNKACIKEKYTFIYPSFPNRGLLQLLQMWPRIISRYPQAKLNIFCDTQNTWCQKYWKEDMLEVDRLLAKYISSVTNHGWVNGTKLKEFWGKSHIWFYPCTFKETCCLTAWEAAASKTLVVSNNLAALETSIGNRGIIIQGNPSEDEWKDKALEQLFNVLENESIQNEYTSRNYEWVKTKNFQDVVSDFEKRFI